MTADKAALVPVRQIPAHELVLDQIRRSLELGQFRPGDRLPTERELTELLQVSRTTVRSALYVLEREGLIEVRRGRGGGFIVQAPKYDATETRREMRKNKKAIRDAFEYRSAVEVAATRLAAERRRVSDVNELHRLLSAMDKALGVALGDQTAHNVHEFQTLDNTFHLTIARASQNNLLIEAVADARRKMWLPVGAVFGRLEPNANDFHEVIVEAIENKDPETAGEKMNEHINSTRSTVESYLKR
ncbi:putative GntR family transcriptional regulator [Gordonia paraffinivorans NBRC 108238]|uniref:GntR family transcriptional regulator n=2 Tax=Gordonia paraffinivorans TaxID=175628 RepID=A0ABQ0IN80_9ACTN|nr:FCD domain-containing protein [Gordonia paraffinivorans]GAC85005.1 putative GntR family transcriptional regulator [Gordonia paraffinivorans NBRC 108238]VFA88684.1 L-lactate utilization operon repressor [Gordonia paraffinivorans]